jgi:hypothetical protein
MDRYRGVLEFYEETEVERAWHAADWKDRLRQYCERDRLLPDRGSVADVLRGAGLGDCDDAMASALLAQHLRCAACGCSFKLRRFADSEAQQCLPVFYDNAIFVCRRCAVEGVDVPAVLRREIGPMWNQCSGNPFVAFAPVPAHQPEPDFDFEFDATPPSQLELLESVVRGREPAFYDDCMDSYR